jgi:hypothetical protein
MVSCVGLRRAARALLVARRTVEHRFRRLAAHAECYQRNRLHGAALRGPFQLDEMESFEANRYQPVTIPVLIQRRTFFLVASAVGPLRRKGNYCRGMTNRTPRTPAQAAGVAPRAYRPEEVPGWRQDWAHPRACPPA